MIVERNYLGLGVVGVGAGRTEEEKESVFNGTCLMSLELIIILSPSAQARVLADSQRGP